jgi:hypothetical protein
MKWIYLLLGCVMPLITGCGEESVDKGNPPPDPRLKQAVEAAKQELKQRQYPYSDQPLLIKADEPNSAWNQRLARTPSLKDLPSVQAMKLDQQAFWAIYVAPAASTNRVIKGGDAFVFIDKANLKVLGVLFGK